HELSALERPGLDNRRAHGHGRHGLAVYDWKLSTWSRHPCLPTTSARAGRNACVTWHCRQAAVASSKYVRVCSQSAVQPGRTGPCGTQMATLMRRILHCALTFAWFAALTGSFFGALSARAGEG